MSANTAAKGTKPKKTKEEEGESKNLPNCRFYEQQYPEVNDLVMVEVKSVDEPGVYVTLKEYNDIEGMILLSELSRRRIRSINKIIRIGRLEVVVVLRVDKEKGYIDLSKRRVTEEDIIKCEEKYTKAKTVHSIMRHVADLLHLNLEELYQKVGWPLYKKYGHAAEAFKLALTDATVFDPLNLPEDLKDTMVKVIRRRMAPQPVKIRADFELICFQYEGIDAIKEALRKGEEASTEQIPIKIKLVAPPLYVMVTTSLNKEAAVAAVTKALDIVKEEITKRKGELTVKVPPRAVHEREERELHSLMERLEKENKEGEDEEEGDEEGEEDEEGDEEGEEEGEGKE